MILRIFISLIAWIGVANSGSLYPYESETREVKILDGIWNFRTSGQDQEIGFREHWYKAPLSQDHVKTSLRRHFAGYGRALGAYEFCLLVAEDGENTHRKAFNEPGQRFTDFPSKLARRCMKIIQTGDVIPMPVPSSYNDITQNKTIRDYIGWVWYDTDFFVPLYWNPHSRKVILRFGGAHYNARIDHVKTSLRRHFAGYGRALGAYEFCLLVAEDGENTHRKAFNEPGQRFTDFPSKLARRCMKIIQTGDVIPMPVPSSYNDITQNKTIRDYIGWVWYDTDFFVPLYWNPHSRKVILRFGGAHYNARIFLNGERVTNHTGGHLPFSVDATQFLIFGGKNRLSVALNNTLSPTTVPQGSVVFETDSERYPPGYHVQKLNFDFFNYAGIHRSVVLYNIPAIYIDDITITIDINGSSGIIKYIVTPINISYQSSPRCNIQLYNKERKQVAEANGCQGTITVKDANFWWPQTMHKYPGYLYTMKIQLKADNITDIYYQSVGIRTVQVVNNTFLINGKPFYFMGFGKHEDANIRGKGLDLPLIIKDYNLIKWIGANAFRTSHYPYSEEMMDQADVQGIVVINECPAVGLNQFNSDVLNQHLKEITELIQRDKNRPSVVMWSVANEPTSGATASEKYFNIVTSHARALDSTRPITAALSVDYAEDKIGQFMDVIMVNRYYGWYSDTGHTEVIVLQILHDITNFHLKYKKPVMISEYGADTVTGLHMDPSYVFTEDYQTEFIMEYHKAFDNLRQKGFFIGELIWNFADFLTDQSITRVVGNKKGIFTRERQPKAAAKILRCRYHHLANNTIKDSISSCPLYYTTMCQ